MHYGYGSTSNKNIIENVNAAVEGELTPRIVDLNIDSKFVKCPHCKHFGDILTLAHLQKEHGLTLEQAKKARSEAEQITPYKKRGEAIVKEYRTKKYG